MPYTPWFPEPGSYIRYFDFAEKRVKYRKLLWQRGPLTYPRRLPAVSAGSTGDALTLAELNPFDTKKHVYLAYLGVQPGFQYFIYHPYDVKNLKWDEDVKDINADLTAGIGWEASPYEYPTKALGIERDRYPAIAAKNLTGSSGHPAIVIVASQYVTVPHDRLSSEEMSRLESGALRSYPWDFGGEM